MRTIVLIGVIVVALSAGTAAAQSAFVKRPTADDLEKFYPPGAKGAQTGGLASITCQVGQQGQLNDCAVANEQPAGMGFGDAALKLAPLFQMSPQVSGKVTVPIRFGLTAAPAAGGNAAPLLTGPYFVAKPSASDVAGVYPKAARAAGTDGAAQIRCSIAALGALTGCAVEAETPKDQGFGAAALKLAPLFKLNQLTYDGKPVAGGSISIPITFSAK